MEEELIGIAFIKIRINDLRLSQLRANSIKAEIGKIAQCSEFSNFSKEELLEFFKKPAIEKLEELITEIKAAKFK
jgi:hypothetical protein